MGRLDYVLTEQGTVHGMDVNPGDSGSPIFYNYESVNYLVLQMTVIF